LPTYNTLFSEKVTGVSCYLYNNSFANGEISDNLVTLMTAKEIRQDWCCDVFSDTSVECLRIKIMDEITIYRISNDMHVILRKYNLFCNEKKNVILIIIIISNILGKITLCNTKILIFYCLFILLNKFKLILKSKNPF
jgi:hypothetical protein